MPGSLPPTSSTNFFRTRRSCTNFLSLTNTTRTVR
jgi:hypothetical protein